jgi:hypothetical protein
LRRKGYNPSETSDHYFGNVVLISSERKVERYGDYYPYSVGACDIVPKCAGGAQHAFDKLIVHANKKRSTLELPGGDVKLGQLILERRGSSQWLHIANHPSVVYCDRMCEILLRRTPFLVTLDNGKTYKEAA